MDFGLLAVRTAAQVSRNYVKLQETLLLGVKYERFIFGRSRVEEMRYKIWTNFKSQSDSILYCFMEKKAALLKMYQRAQLDKSTQNSCRHSKRKRHRIIFVDS